MDKLNVVNDQNISEYRNALKFLIDNNYKKSIHNNSTTDAACHIALFFDHAKKHVKIFCKELLKSVYDTDFLVESLKNALMRGIKVLVLMQEAAPDSEKFLTVLKDKGGLLYIAKGKVKKSKINYSVMDKKAIRFEECNNNCAAISKLNTKKAKEYSKLFDKMIKNFAEEYKYVH